MIAKAPVLDGLHVVGACNCMYRVRERGVCMVLGPVAAPGPSFGSAGGQLWGVGGAVMVA